ncbi:hypothetical protein BJL76_13120 [Vibrio parahaemolyticus]|nr:hypothetical protein BJL76_13120 [Vibrio parahaemolyticus]OOX58396.1 hypothetical protein BJL79_11825 [Vibrio parahaemolyticus]
MKLLALFVMKLLYQKNINKIILVIDVALSNLSTNYVEVYEYESNKAKYETIILARNKFF